MGKSWATEPFRRGAEGYLCAPCGDGGDDFISGSVVTALRPADESCPARALLIYPGSDGARSTSICEDTQRGGGDTVTRAAHMGQVDPNRAFRFLQLGIRHVLG